MSANGPQSDYPVVVGPAYSVAGVGYTPEDVMNYDQVGYLAADAGAGISAAHHTLPLPSYVEVTSLATGRTILARVERRGPAAGNEVLALSPAALAQLDASPGTPVRVRRVNPPEDQRAVLRSGNPASLRMDTPMSLVDVLKRKLPAPGAPAVRTMAATTTTPVLVAAAAVVKPAVAVKSPIKPAVTSVARLTESPFPKVAAAPILLPLAPRLALPVAVLKPPVSASMVPSVPSRAFSTGRFEIQAGAFALADNAKKAAGRLSGKVTSAGKLFRVRTGPFATRGEAEAALAKVRAAGYSDARIQTSG
ncbi:MAG: SPOR domain-containing protein [Croceibacterium sp.]